MAATASPQPRTSELAAAATPPPWMWLALPDYILVRISAFLPCLTDRVHMACVHRQWNAAVRDLKRPRPAPLQPQLPWLIFPRSDGEAPTFYSVMNRSYHSLGRLPPHACRARFCGSAKDGWLVLALESSTTHELYNLNSGRRIPLPAGFTAPTPTDQDSPLVVRVAALSDPPSPNPNSRDKCMVAAIAHVGRTLTAAFWREGSESWLAQGDLMTAAPQDVIHYFRSFFFVTSREELVAFWPMYGPNMHRVDYVIQQRADYDADVRRASTIRHYLVESQYRLLMVVRYIFDEDGTEALRVFTLNAVAPISVDHPVYIWEDLGERALDGRMLFLGAGCSRSFDVADYAYDGCGFEESTIYFLDDGLAYTLSPDGTKRYSFTDMGRYSLEKRTSEPWPPGHPSTSDNAPPNLVAPLTWRATGR